MSHQTKSYGNGHIDIDAILAKLQPRIEYVEKPLIVEKLVEVDNVVYVDKVVEVEKIVEKIVEVEAPKKPFFKRLLG